jgi:hypothetical protein
LLYPGSSSPEPLDPLVRDPGDGSIRRVLTPVAEIYMGRLIGGVGGSTAARLG